MNGEVNISGYVTPTETVCIRRGWLKDTGRTTQMPSGSTANIYDLSLDGIDALEDFLRETRFKRAAPQ